jgi:protein-disulfide isomerase
MKVMLSFATVAMLMLSTACSEGISRPSYLFKPAPTEGGLVAKAGPIEITQDELIDGMETEIFEAETKLFEIKFNRMKSLLLQRYIDKDSRKGNLSNDEFLNKFIAKDVNISEKEVDAFIKDQNIPSEHINPQVREKIKGFLGNERKKEAVDKWLAEQTKKTPVEVYLKKPRRPTFPVEVGNAPSTGAKDAKVTIVEYSDFQCPYCAQGSQRLRDIKKKYGNKVKIAFKNFPLPFHNHAEQAAVAALCANEQNTDLFWKMHDEMFANQDALDKEGLKGMAKKVGLKVDAFETCLNENRHLAQVQADMAEGRKIKVKSTPTFFVNGQLIQGALPLEVFTELIDEQLAQ